MISGELKRKSRIFSEAGMNRSQRAVKILQFGKARRFFSKKTAIQENIPIWQSYKLCQRYIRIPCHSKTLSDSGK